MRYPIELIPIIDKAIANNDYATILKILNELHFDINQYGRAGITPLHCAIKANKPHLVKLFLFMGANPYQRGDEGRPLVLARKLGRQQIEGILVNFIAIREVIADDGSKKKFIDAIKNGDAQTVLQMLSGGFAYNDIDCREDLHTGLELAVAAQSFEIVALLVEKGAIISDRLLQNLLNENAVNPWCRSIAKFLKLEKQNQIDIMEAFCKANGNLEACSESIEIINKKFEDDIDRHRAEHVTNLEEQKSQDEQQRLGRENQCAILKQKIAILNQYGNSVAVKTLAQGLRTQVEYFIMTGDKKTASDKISKLIKDGQSTMGEDRRLRDIIAHIILGLTGIGLIVMGIHKAYTSYKAYPHSGTFFLNSTKRQKILREINKEAQQLTLSNIR